MTSSDAARTGAPALLDLAIPWPESLYGSVASLGAAIQDELFGKDPSTSPKLQITYQDLAEYYLYGSRYPAVDIATILCRVAAVTCLQDVATRTAITRLTHPQPPITG